MKIGVITFLSGPAASPFGVPARNAAEVVIELLNAGKAPAPYATKGFGGAPIQTVIIDEAGSSTTQVTEYRNLVQRHNVDVVIGYVSSGNCIAVAPVAEELKKLTNFFDCGTPRIFEDASYKYVFRTSPTATMDSVGAALYVKDAKPKMKSIAGLNQNYAWGQDSWADFEAAMKQLVPNIQVKTSQMPKLFAGQFNAEISTLLGENADVIHSSFYDGDLEALLLAGRAARAVQEEHGDTHHGRDRHVQARGADPRRHDHRGARPVRPVRPQQRVEPLVLEGVPGSLPGAAELCFLSDGAGDSGGQGRMGEGAGCKRREAAEQRTGGGCA